MDPVLANSFVIITDGQACLHISRALLRQEENQEIKIWEKHQGSRKR